MTIPLATTLITIARMPEDNSDPTDPYDPEDSPAAAWVEVVAGVRAVISVPSVSVSLSGGNMVVYTSKLTSDLCDLQPGDQVTDSDGTVWLAMFAHRTLGFGLDHMDAEVRFDVGAAS